MMLHATIAALSQMILEVSVDALHAYIRNGVVEI